MVDIDGGQCAARHDGLAFDEQMMIRLRDDDASGLKPFAVDGRPGGVRAHRTENARQAAGVEPMCSTMRTAAGKSAGSCDAIVRSAATPPADAPITTLSRTAAAARHPSPGIGNRSCRGSGIAAQNARSGPP